MLNRQDERRKDQVVKTLLKAKEQLETAALYLLAKDPLPYGELYKLNGAKEQVIFALTHLEADVLLKGGDQV